jgi:hypothetical protein
MGRALHVLQDFYSHTDWIDGWKLCTTYWYYNDTYHRKWVLRHDTHSETLNLRAIYNRNWSGLNPPQELYYFDGGYSPIADDDHNRYAADKPGFGRDGAKFLPGSYRRAYNAALRQSIEFLEWSKHNMNIKFRLFLFNLGTGFDDPTGLA